MRKVVSIRIPAQGEKEKFVLPSGAVFLATDSDTDTSEVILYYEVDPRLPKVEHTMYYILHGQTLPQGFLAYRGSLQMERLKFTFHLYEDTGKLMPKPRKGPKTNRKPKDKRDEF